MLNICQCDSLADLAVKLLNVVEGYLSFRGLRCNLSATLFVAGSSLEPELCEYVMS